MHREGTSEGCNELFETILVYDVGVIRVRVEARLKMSRNMNYV